MPSVAICSNMRADSEYETAYYLQVLGLATNGFRIASVNVVYDREPTSSAWVRDLLESRGIPVRYQIEVQSGNVAFKELADKCVQWAALGNQVMQLALSADDEPTHLAFVEADLSYAYDTFQVLLARKKPIIAPMIYLNNIFYDGWGFRSKSGERLSTLPPITPLLSCQPVELSSVGSFVLIEASVFRAGVRFRGEYDNGLIVGVCQDAGKLGFETYMDATISILHPVSAWRDQCWKLNTLYLRVEGVLVSQARLDDVLVAGPFEEVVRPWVDLKLDKHLDPSFRKMLTIARLDGKRLDVTVDIVRPNASQHLDVAPFM